MAVTVEVAVEDVIPESMVVRFRWGGVVLRTGDGAGR